MEHRRTWVLALVAMALALAALLLFGQTTAIGSPQPDWVIDATPDGLAAIAAGSAWSSGWVEVPRGQSRTFDHNLGGDPEDYVVELWFLDTDTPGLGINRRAYGGLEVLGKWQGGHWEKLTSNTIDVYRHADDVVADQIFVRLQVAPNAPDWDSDWRWIKPGETLTLTHGLGTTATDLTVSLWFSGTVRGIHHHGYGGLAIDGPTNNVRELQGAHWHNLTDNEVSVTRHPDDKDVEQVRVVVVQGDPPAYDSLVDLGGWQAVAQGAFFQFDHNLNWNPLMMLVRGECLDSLGGIHQWLAGGSVKSWPPGGAKGAHLQRLTPRSVQIFRLADDDICPEVRVRIWTRSARTYLPFAVLEH
jgi:hypothetical protein